MIVLILFYLRGMFPAKYHILSNCHMTYILKHTTLTKNVHCVLSRGTERQILNNQFA